MTTDALSRQFPMAKPKPCSIHASDTARKAGNAPQPLVSPKATARPCRHTSEHHTVNPNPESEAAPAPDRAIEPNAREPLRLFPLEAMPEPLRGVAIELSGRTGASTGSVVMAMLGAIAAAAGNQSSFEPWPGRNVPPCLNLLFGCPGADTVAVLEDVWGPLFAVQRTGAEKLANRDAEWLDAEATKLRRARAQHLERIPFPAAADLQYFDAPLADIRLARWPALLRRDPAPGCIDAVAPDHTAVLFTLAGRAGLAMDYWASDAGRLERELLVTGWRQRANSHTCQSLSGSVSVTMLASPEETVRFLTARWAVQSGLAGTFLVVRDDSEPAEQDDSGISRLDCWAEWLRRLFRWRLEGRPHVVRPSDKARAVPENSARQASTWAARLSPEHHHMATHRPEQLLRVALAIHLGTGQIGAQLSAQTARAASEVSRWLSDQQARTPFPTARRRSFRTHQQSLSH